MKYSPFTSMTHLYKVPLEHSDMFVRGVDVDKNLINYQIFSKEGKPMEPIKNDTYVIHNNEIVFDKNRSLPVQLVNHIIEILE